MDPVRMFIHHPLQDHIHLAYLDYGEYKLLNCGDVFAHPQEIIIMFINDVISFRKAAAAPASCYLLRFLVPSQYKRVLVHGQILIQSSLLDSGSPENYYACEIQIIQSITILVERTWNRNSVSNILVLVRLFIVQSELLSCGSQSSKNISNGE